MPAANPILTPDRGKAHSAALAVLCVLAVVQVAAMGRAVWLANSRSVAPVASSPGSEAPAARTTPAPLIEPSAPVLMTPPPVPAFRTSVSAQPIAASAKTRAAPSVSAPSPPQAAGEIQELLELARQLRPLGDLNGTLEVLKRADLKAPDHPAVLAEIVTTYEQMGLREKAAAAREKLAAINAKVGR